MSAQTVGRQWAQKAAWAPSSDRPGSLNPQTLRAVRHPNLCCLPDEKSEAQRSPELVQGHPARTPGARHRGPQSRQEGGEEGDRQGEGWRARSGWRPRRVGGPSPTPADSRCPCQLPFPGHYTPASQVCKAERYQVTLHLQLWGPPWSMG